MTSILDMCFNINYIVQILKRLPKIKSIKLVKSRLYVYITLVGLTSAVALTTYLANQNQTLKSVSAEIQVTQEETANILENVREELEDLKNQDQIKINEELRARISNIESTYLSAVAVYEELLKLKETNGANTDGMDSQFTKALIQLSEQNYEEAVNTLNDLSSSIKQEADRITALSIPPQVTAPESNSPPGSGYSRQYVNTDDAGRFLVSMIAADLANSRVIVDTASDGDCSNDCPVLPLAEYVSRNNAYAGINGSYFCPAEYPSCAGKTNTYDLLLMNHKKTYFNSDNNVYSNNPVVVFYEGSVRFIEAGTHWGRDTSPTGVLMNYPLLLFNGEVRFGGDDDPKKGSRGGRSFVANKGNTVYIGVVHSATVAESARVMKALGFENAINLDNGGSTALWSGGYRVGPGRNLPNVILFVTK